MAVHFDAASTSDFITMGNPSALAIAANAPMAMCCWVTFNSIAGTQTLLGKGYDGTSTSYVFQIVPGPPTLNWTSFNSGTGTHGVQIPLSSMGVTTGPWYHFYGEYTGSGTHWNFYVNGILQASVPDAVGPQSNSTNFEVGAVDLTGTPGQWFSGCIADAAVFNGPLTGAEILALGTGVSRPSISMSQTLLGYWTLNTNITTQPDLSGNHNDGTSAGSTIALCGDSPPYVAAPTFVLMGQICA